MSNKLFYRGSSSKDFQVKRHVDSRYGFPALFFSSELEIARLYAAHNAREKHNHAGGYVYSMEIMEPMKRIDYKFKVTRCAHFRNLMYELFNSGMDSALVRNALDFPSSDTRQFLDSDILVVFDLSIIPAMELVESNVV